MLMHWAKYYAQLLSALKQTGTSDRSDRCFKFYYLQGSYLFLEHAHHMISMGLGELLGNMRIIGNNVWNRSEQCNGKENRDASKFGFLLHNKHVCIKNYGAKHGNAGNSKSRNYFLLTK